MDHSFWERFKREGVVRQLAGFLYSAGTPTEEMMVEAAKTVVTCDLHPCRCNDLYVACQAWLYEQKELV